VQAVILSARPDVLDGTWRAIRRLMPWVDRAVVVAPGHLVAEMAHPDWVVLSDEEASGCTTAELRALDHTSRNTLLRRHLASHEAVEDEFLLADDDYRPLRPVDRDAYGPPGRHRMRWFYDLRAWPGDSTSFDEAQHRTGEVLSYLGAPHLAYGSHLPQLVWKDVLAEAFARVRQVLESDLLCEWSVYANLGAAMHPDRFDPPVPFSTLCWPQYAGEWPWWVEPTAPLLFENHYPELYAGGHLFAGLPPEAPAGREDEVAFEKWQRWLRAGRGARDLEFGPTWDPWTQGSPWRRAAFAGLRAARRGRRTLIGE
jgi:hypothetical protein